MRGFAALNQLYAYVDADHARDLEGCRSISGFVVMMNYCAISWESKHQKVTVLSLVELEFYAVPA
eukprot:207588-Rhodomonas_salina.1